MADGPRTIGIEPNVWFLIFEDTPRRILRRLIPGPWKHVRAVGWVPDQRLWLFYDVGLTRTSVAVAPDCPGAREAALPDGVTILAMQAGERPPLWPRIGFWCVPAVAHLVGLRSCALSPMGLYRDCLRHGAEVVTYGVDDGGELPEADCPGDRAAATG
jgi:hypothetical protein